MKNSLTLEGERALRTLIADYPKAPERPRALWHLAWSNYLGKDYTRAIGFLDQLMRSHPTGKAPSGGVLESVLSIGARSVSREWVR